MITESLNFNPNLSDPVLNDSVAASKITYIGGHLYGTTPKNYANAISKGKRLWMTEHYFDGDTVDVCLNLGKEILDCMYYNMSAYIYWWLREPSANLINSSGFIYKKGYTLAQFSKYVRPGYYRVDATYQPQTNVWLVAFKGAANDVVVVVNKNTTPKVQNFTFKNDNISAAKRYVTSATKSIYDQGTIECTNNSFIDTLDAKSITTYVVTRSVTSSIEKTAEVIRVSPNPASDYIQINNEQDAWVYVFNSLGKIEISKNIKPLEKLDIQTLKSGLHLVSIISGNKKYTSKFVINR
jgi:glucuronoarabinoxylan endo-1,4-beta-xylanase